MEEENERERAETARPRKCWGRKGGVKYKVPKQEKKMFPEAKNSAKNIKREEKRDHNNRKL